MNVTPIAIPFLLAMIAAGIVPIVVAVKALREGQRDATIPLLLIAGITILSFVTWAIAH